MVVQFIDDELNLIQIKDQLFVVTNYMFMLYYTSLDDDSDSCSPTVFSLMSM